MRSSIVSEIPEDPQDSCIIVEDRSPKTFWQMHVSAITTDTTTLQNCLLKSDPSEKGQTRAGGGFLGHSADT